MKGEIELLCRLYACAVGKRREGDISNAESENGGRGAEKSKKKKKNMRL
jgi:hypothetical protein